MLIFLIIKNRRLIFKRKSDSRWYWRGLCCRGTTVFVLIRVGRLFWVLLCQHYVAGGPGLFFAFFVGKLICPKEWFYCHQISGIVGILNQWFSIFHSKQDRKVRCWKKTYCNLGNNLFWFCVLLCSTSGACRGSCVHWPACLPYLYISVE